MMNKTQHELWDRYQKLKEDLDNLKIIIPHASGFIQNDLEYMLEIGHATIDDIQASLPTFQEASQRIADRLEAIKQEFYALTSDVASYLNKLKVKNES